MSDKARAREELRKQREGIDRSILQLLIKRAALSAEVGKSAEGPEPRLPSSARQSLERLAFGDTGDLSSDVVLGIFREIHAACRALEATARVAFVGLRGGFGDVAARQHFGLQSERLPAAGVAAALEMVERQQADFAIVPFETVAEGPALGALLAIRHTDLRVVAVQSEVVPLGLLSRADKLSEINVIYAAAKEHGHAQEFVETHLPHATIEDAKSPLAACEAAAKSVKAAALGAEVIGREFGLANLAQASALNDGSGVRFCVVAKRPASRTGSDATSLLFGLGDAPGALFEVLKLFADRGVNMRKIQSRPAMEEESEYLFFVEISGHATDRAVISALESIKSSVKSLRVLGSYSIPASTRESLSLWALEKAWGVQRPQPHPPKGPP